MPARAKRVDRVRRRSAGRRSARPPSRARARKSSDSARDRRPCRRGGCTAAAECARARRRPASRVGAPSDVEPHQPPAEEAPLETSAWMRDARARAQGPRRRMRAPGLELLTRMDERLASPVPFQPLEQQALDGAAARDRAGRAAAPETRACRWPPQVAGREQRRQIANRRSCHSRARVDDEQARRPARARLLRDQLGGSSKSNDETSVIAGRTSQQLQNRAACQSPARPAR